VEDHIGEAALVLLSELVTNAVRHGGATPDVPVRVDTSIGPRTLRVEVRDPGRGFRNNRIAPGAHGGFGLRVLERSASRWGVEAGEATLVWFELDLA